MSESGKPDPSAPPEIDRAQLVKLGIELAPLLAFFITLYLGGVFVATGVLVAVTVLSVAISHWVIGKVSPMLLISAGFAIVFGLLAIVLREERFIKIKPTAVYLVFATGLAISVAMGKPLMRVLMGEVLNLTQAGWRSMTLRWVGFFLVMAALNEVVWRNFSTEFWAGFKLAAIAISLVFAAIDATIAQRDKAS